jgi:hypothetical protein
VADRAIAAGLVRLRRASYSVDAELIDRVKFPPLEAAISSRILVVKEPGLPSIRDGSADGPTVVRLGPNRCKMFALVLHSSFRPKPATHQRATRARRGASRRTRLHCGASRLLDRPCLSRERNGSRQECPRHSDPIYARSSLTWYEEVLGRIESGAIVAPGEQERLIEEASAAAHLLDLLDPRADKPAS